jgi:hypothetical protein
MDLHPYDIKRHNITHHNNCHAHMHGFINDGRLRACQSCFLGLMYLFKLLYAIKCFRVMVCLGFQLFYGCIKGQVFPFPS